MIDKLIELINTIEPLLLVVIPAGFAVWIKIDNKVKEKKSKIEKQNKNKNKQKLNDWRHNQSMIVSYKLKEACNYYRDKTGCNATFLQLENGTIATSKLSNMFFSCIAEDDRYHSSFKLINTVQRVPFTKLHKWFEKVFNNPEGIAFYPDTNDLDEQIVHDENVKSIISALVKNPDGVIVGACSLNFETEKTLEELREFEAWMLRFSASIETILLAFNFELQKKKEELNLVDEEV